MAGSLKSRVRSLLVRYPERALSLPGIWWRDLTASSRVLPSFIIIGAQRCGTTSLYDYLCQHPQIIPSPVKELFYFDDYFGRPETWYRSFFPREGECRRLADRLGHPVITGEASPSYFFHPYAPGRIARTLPDVKLILVLRNPVERAYSHYNHIRRLDREPLSFEEALAAEEGRIAEDCRRLAEDEGYKADARRDYSYVARGFYAEQLKHWLEFFPRERLLVVQSEEFYSDTPKVYGEILSYLGLEPHTLPVFEAKNGLKYSRMNPETRARLEEIFKEPNEELYRILGRRFDW